jgi:uncharacterized protein YcbK (DUF882 family)
MFRRILFSVSLAIAISGCAGENQDPQRAPAQGEFGGPESTPGNKDQSACYIYPLYKVGDCSLLAKRSTFTGSVKTDYTYAASSDKRYHAPVYLIDLSKIDLSLQVTRNFRLSEFLSTAKGRYGYFAEHVFGYLQGIRESLGGPLRINSGYRSPGYNKKIGGAKLSRHMYGDGADLGGFSVSKLQSVCKSAGASYIQVYTDGHVHCDWRNRPLDDTFVPGVSSADLTPLAVSAMSEEEFVHLQEVIGGKPEITLLGQARAGNRVGLTAAIDLQEDPGDLYTEWIVTTPDGQVFNGEGVVLGVDLAQSGQYQVQVRVGGYAQGSYTIDVP